METADKGPMSEQPADEKEIEQKMTKIITLMPKEVRDRFKCLKVLSDQRSKLNDQFEEEVKALELKIIAKKKPIYEQRSKVISGEFQDFGVLVKTFDDTMADLEKQCDLIVTKKKEEGDKAEDTAQEKDVTVEVDHLKDQKGVPDFWFKAFKNCQMLSELIKEKDEEILKSLTDVVSERSDAPKSVTVRLHFKENQYFENDHLWLKLIYKSDGDQVEKSESCEIKWKEGMDATKKKIKKKQKHKKTNETRTIVKTVEADSMFNVFKSLTAPNKPDEAESDEEEAMLLDKLDEQMNFCEDIDDVLIPDALEYYLGLNEDFGEGLSGDDKSDSDNDDDDDDDEKPKPEKKKGGKKKDEKEQECKQQ